MFTAMQALYRDTMAAARESLAAARKKRRAGLEAVRALAPAHAARMRRRTAGWTLLLFATGIAFVVVLPAWGAFDPSLASGGLWGLIFHANPVPGLATSLLIASWPAAALAGGLAGRLAHARFDRAIDRELAALGDETRTADPYAALASLATQVPLARRLVASVRRQESVSVAAWLAGASLCLPLTLHLAVALAAATMGVMIHGPAVFADVIRGFDGWIALSGLVAHALAATALYAIAFARQVASDEEALPQWQVPLALATGAAVIFPALLLGLHVGALGLLPVMLVFVTGGAFLPVLYGALSRALRRERFLLDSAEADLDAAEA